MSKHMIIWKNNVKNNDKIEVYSFDPSYVVLSERNDREYLKNIEESKKPGIYILYDELNNRYIGQASDSVLDRINEHNKSKPWWTNVVFFGRDDGKLDKSQLDYLEHKLIRFHKEKEFNVTNGNDGNTSFIDPFQRGRAESLWENTLEILEESVKADFLTKNNSMSTVENPQVSTDFSTSKVLPHKMIESSDSSFKNGVYSIQYNNSESLEDKHLSEIYRLLLTDLSKDESYLEEFYKMIQSKDREIKLFSKVPVFYKDNRSSSFEIKKDLHAFKGKSQDQILRKVKKICEHLDVDYSLLFHSDGGFDIISSNTSKIVKVENNYKVDLFAVGNRIKYVKNSDFNNVSSIEVLITSKDQVSILEVNNAPILDTDTISGLKNYNYIGEMYSQMIDSSTYLGREYFSWRGNSVGTSLNKAISLIYGYQYKKGAKQLTWELISVQK